MSFGYNQHGDFDQLSLQGVDFGADYTKDYGVEPNNLQGSYEMNGYYNQMGVVPMGMSGYHDQLGAYHHQMGMHNYQMGFLQNTLATVPAGMPLVGGMNVKTWHVLAALGLGYLAYSQGMLARFGL